jgi:hypothetical protein
MGTRYNFATFRRATDHNNLNHYYTDDNYINNHIDYDDDANNNDLYDVDNYNPNYNHFHKIDDVNNYFNHHYHPNNHYINNNNANNYYYTDNYNNTNHNGGASHVHDDDDSDSRRLQNHPKSWCTSGPVSRHHGGCWQQHSNHLHGRLHAGRHVHHSNHTICSIAQLIKSISLIDSFGQFYTNSGTTLITGSAVVGTTYTSTDNTLTIESLAGSSNSSTLCCTWKTV